MHCSSAYIEVPSSRILNMDGLHRRNRKTKIGDTESPLVVGNLTADSGVGDKDEQKFADKYALGSNALDCQEQSYDFKELYA